MKKRKRVLVISDLHCGHDLGLTHPTHDKDTVPAVKPHHWEVRRHVWSWFAKTVDAMGRIDILLVNGDAIDGKGEASGGTEQLYSDRNDQVELASLAIQYVGARKVFMSYGTPYHAGKKEDWEDAVARDEKVKAEKIGGEDTIDINGLLINFRHHVGRSTVPHGRHTAVAKEKLWNNLWAERGEYPKADVLIRSHVHYYTYCGNGEWLAMTTPSLQGYGTKYGGRKMIGTVDIGVTVFNVAKDGAYTWKAELLRFPMQEPISL